MNTRLPLVVLGTLISFCCTASPVLAGSVAFQYDAAGRLTKASFATPKAINYTYAPSGNLTFRQIDLGSPDSDSDGLADAWELLYFGNLTRNGTGDFDADGSNDLSEFLAGTDPSSTASVLKITRATVNGTISVNVEWSSVVGKNYRLQFKNSLNDSSWTDISGDVQASGAAAAKDDNAITGNARRFYRVKLLP